MEKEKRIPIAAFCARGREVGYVLMHQGRIIRYGVKTVKGKRSGKEFIKRVGQIRMSITDRLTPRCLIVVEDRADDPKVGGIGRAIHAHVKDKHYAVCIPLKDAKQYLCGSMNVTHSMLAESVVLKYPDLQGLRRDFVMYRPLYWELVLMAVALAETASKS